MYEYHIRELTFGTNQSKPSWP